MSKLKHFSFYIIVGLLFGIFLGAFLSLIGAEPSLSSMGLSLLIFVVFLFVTLPAHVIIHEMGHGVMGMLSGFSFVSLRIFDYQFSRQGGSWQLRKVHIPATLGQCLLEPKKEWQETNFTPYLLGGGLFNLICALVLFYLGLEARFGGYWEIFFAGGISGAFVGLSNLMPLTMSGVATDGKNIGIIKNSPQAKEAMWTQLKVGALLTQGKRWEEISPDYFPDLKGDYGDNYLNRQWGFLAASYWSGRAQILRAERILSEIGSSSRLLGLEAMVYYMGVLEIRRKRGDWDSYRSLYQSVESQILPLAKTEDGLYSRYIYEKYCLDQSLEAKSSWEKFLTKARTSPYPGLTQDMIEEEMAREQEE